MKAYWTKSMGTHSIEINGHKVEFHVTASAYHDECFELDWDFEPGEKEKLVAKINSGELTPCFIRVIAHNVAADAVNGEDSLGGVLAAGEADVLETIEEHGMVKQALCCAHDNTRITADRLSRFAATKEQS